MDIIVHAETLACILPATSCYRDRIQTRHRSMLLLAVVGSEATAKRLLRSDYPPPEVVALLYSVLRVSVLST